MDTPINTADTPINVTPLPIKEPSPFADTPMVDAKHRIEDAEVESVLLLLQKSLQMDLEDEDQNKLVDAIQANRALLLKYAMQQYLAKPGSASLLEGVTSLLGHMEKVVRDNRKEKAKKKEGEHNVVAFNQMLEAMKSISSGAIAVPVFEIGTFLLDPSKSLLGDNDNIAPIKPDELTQGIQIVDIDGKAV
jgi:hypothetical protein